MAGTDLISEPGQFWLAGDPSGFIPETATRGAVTVDHNGTAMLSLDSSEWKWGKNFDLDALQDRNFDICAFMPGMKKYLHIRDGMARDVFDMSSGWGANTICSHFSCLSNSETLDTSKHNASSLHISLENVWPWLGFDTPTVHEFEGRVEVYFPIRSAQQFNTGTGSVSISAARPELGDSNKSVLCIKQKAWLDFRWNEPNTAYQAKKCYDSIDELVVLLTDHEISLYSPELELSDGSIIERLFCTRARRRDCGISASDCWILLSQISTHFGDILEKWLVFQEQYRASLDLYFATRLGRDLFMVHEFVTIFWAVEALYKKSPPDRTAQTSSCRSRPKAAENIENLLSSLPLSFDKESLETFCQRCVDTRNDISHGEATRAEAHAFEVADLCLALKSLYHAVILQRIGVPDAALKWSFHQRPRGRKFKRDVNRAGLKILDPT